VELLRRSLKEEVHCDDYVWSFMGTSVFKGLWSLIVALPTGLTNQ